MLRCEEAGHCIQVSVGQMCHQMIQRRIDAAALSKIDQLVVQVALRFAGNAREVAGAGGAALLAMAHHAGARALRHAVDCSACTAACRRSEGHAEDDSFHWFSMSI